MYQYDNMFRNYTWNPKWSIPYETIWGRIEKFRCANVMAIDQRFIYTRPYSYSESVFDKDLVAYRIGPCRVTCDLECFKIDDSILATFRNYQFFFDDQLRYCSECIKYGYHSLFHQIRLFNKCIFHPEIRLSNLCKCKETYSVKMKPIHKVKGFSCDKCGSMLPVADVAEGILGMWEAKNLVPKIEEGVRQYKQKLDEIKITIIDIKSNFNQSYYSRPKSEICEKYIKIFQEILETGNANCLPTFTCMKNIDTKGKSINGVFLVNEYLNTYVKKETIKETFAIIGKSGRFGRHYYPLDKKECDPEAVILIYLLKGLTQTSDVRNLLYLDFSDDYLDKNVVKNYYRRIMNTVEAQWCPYHTEVHNFLYSEHIRNEYELLKTCYWSDDPFAFPSDARGHAYLPEWKYPKYMMVEDNVSIKLYQEI